MIKTAPELLQELAGRIRVRRVALGWPQQEAAQRSGVAYRTWRRLETQGKASIEDLIKAALALRCEFQRKPAAYSEMKPAGGSEVKPATHSET